MVSDNHSVPRIYEYFAWGTTIRQLEQLYSIHYYTIITLHVSSLLYKQRDPKLPFPVATHTHQPIALLAGQVLCGGHCG